MGEHHGDTLELLLQVGAQPGRAQLACCIVLFVYMAIIIVWRRD